MEEEKEQDHGIVSETKQDNAIDDDTSIHVVDEATSSVNVQKLEDNNSSNTSIPTPSEPSLPNSSDPIPHFFSQHFILKWTYTSFYPYFHLIILNPVYKWLFFSAIVANIGTYLSNIALLSMVESTFSKEQKEDSSGLALAGLLVCYYIPPIIMMPFTGMLSDFFDKRKIMLYADVARGLLVLLFLLVDFLGVHQFLWLLYVALFSLCCHNSFFDVCRESTIPFVVKAEYLFAANALDSLTWMSTTFIGSALGGVISSMFGYKICFIVDCITYFVSAIFVFQLFRAGNHWPVEHKETSTSLQETNSVPTEEPVQVSSRQKIQQVLIKIVKLLFFKIVNYVKEFLSTFWFLARNRYLLTLAITRGIYNFAWTGLDIVYLKYCEEYKINNDLPLTLGITKSIIGLCSGLSPAITQPILSKSGDRTKRIIPVIGFFLLASGYLLLYFANSYPLALLANIICASAAGMLWVFCTFMDQLLMPNEYLGRIFAFDFSVFNGMSVGSVLMVGILLGPLKLNYRIPVLIVSVYCLSFFFLYILWFIMYWKTKNEKYKIEKPQPKVIESTMLQDEDEKDDVELIETHKDSLVSNNTSV